MTTPLSPALQSTVPDHAAAPRELRDPARTLGTAELRARHVEVQRGLREHLPALHRHAARRARSRDEALDLVQETALRALAFAWSFERGTNLRAWLHQVQDSVFLTQCRKRTRERRAFDAFYLDPCAWPKHEAEPAMRRMTQSVTRALDDLPTAFRDVVRLVDIEELSYRDAADTLRVPLGTIMSRLHRGRRMLATALADSHSSRRDQTQNPPVARPRPNTTTATTATAAATATATAAATAATTTTTSVARAHPTDSTPPHRAKPASEHSRHETKRAA